MARMKKKNLLMGELSGMIGKRMVIKQYKDKIVVSAAPARSSKAPTQEQQGTRTRFQEASLMVKLLFRNEPDKKNVFSAIAKHTGKSTAYNAARGAFINRLCLKTIDLINDKPGKKPRKEVGRRLGIALNDNYGPKLMQVTITSADGSILSKGQASFTWGTDAWIYLVPEDIAIDKETMVLVETADYFDRRAKFQAKVGAISR